MDDNTLINVPTVTASPFHGVSALLTKFKDINPSRPKPNAIGAVPLYRSRLYRVNKPAPSLSNDADKAGEEEHEETEQYEVQKFKDLKEFKPNVLTEQLNEACILGIEDFANPLIEQLLNELIGEHPYEWSCLEEGDSKVLFVRLKEKEVKENAFLMKRLTELDIAVHQSKLKIVVEKNTRQLIEDTVPNDEISIDKEALQRKVDRLLEKNKAKKTAKTVDYVIDEEELRGVPQDALPQLIKDIKEFRLKVLENERKKREKEVLEEKKRSKAQLRKLFEKYQSDSDRMVEDDDDESDEEDDDLTDEQYEELRIKKENADMLKKFRDKLRSVESIQRRNKDVLRELEELRNYEQSLDKTLKPEYEHGRFRRSGRDKKLEMEADQKDREEELTENKAAKEADNFLSTINIPLKVNISKSLTLEDLDDDQLDSLLQRLKPKLDEYMEEILGTKEDELSDYIISIIKDEKNKEKLAQELEEAFADDAESLRDKIWNDIEVFIKEFQ